MLSRARVALLRGVNVGGNKKIPMAALREICVSLGFERPETYVQSGNVVFSTSLTPDSEIARRLEQAIEAAVAFHADVVVRSAAELRGVIAENPFSGERETAKLLVTFLGSDPGDAARAAAVALCAGFVEDVRFTGRHVYTYFPEGMGRSKLPVEKIGRALGVTGTARNWNTVTKLAEMAGARE